MHHMVIDELVEWGWRWRPLVVLSKDGCCKEAEEEKQNKICQCGSKLAAGQHRAVIYVLANADNLALAMEQRFNLHIDNRVDGTRHNHWTLC